MRTQFALPMLVALVGCSAARTDAQIPAAPEIEVLLRNDSAGAPDLAVDTLQFPNQAPWHSDFFVRLRFSAEYPLQRLEARVGVDVWMGPQVYGGPDGELLLELEADRLGSWYRSDILRVAQLSFTPGGTREAILGPFPLLDLIPGPDGADAKLWPTRIKIVLDVVPLERTSLSTQSFHGIKIIALR